MEQKNQQLEVKDEQIRELNARLAESNAALVAAQQTAQAAQALHAGTVSYPHLDVYKRQMPERYSSSFLLERLEGSHGMGLSERNESRAFGVSFLENKKAVPTYV